MIKYLFGKSEYKLVYKPFNPPQQIKGHYVCSSLEIHKETTVVWKELYPNYLSTDQLQEAELNINNNPEKFISDGTAS